MYKKKPRQKSKNLLIISFRNYSIPYYYRFDYFLLTFFSSKLPLSFLHGGIVLKAWPPKFQIE